MNYNKLMNIANKHQQNAPKQKSKMESKTLDARRKEDERKKALEEKKKKMEAIRARVAANVNKKIEPVKKEEPKTEFNVLDMTADPDAKFECDKRKNALSAAQKEKLRKAFLEKKERLKQIDFDAKSCIRARISGEFVEDNWSDEEEQPKKVTKPEASMSDKTKVVKSEKTVSSSSHHHKHKHKHSREKTSSSLSSSSSSLSGHKDKLKHHSSSGQKHDVSSKLSSYEKKDLSSKLTSSEKQQQPHKEKKQKKHKKEKRDKDSGTKAISASKTEPEKPVKPKPKPVVKRPANTGPPPLNFSDLLSMASKNDGKFGKDVPKVKKPAPKKQNHPRLMTAEERDYFESEKDHEMRQKGLKAEPPIGKSSDPAAGNPARSLGNNMKSNVQAKPSGKTNGTGLSKNRVMGKQTVHDISDDEDDVDLEPRQNIGAKNNGSRHFGGKSAPPPPPSVKQKPTVSHHLDKLKKASKLSTQAQHSPSGVSGPRKDLGKPQPGPGKQSIKSKNGNQPGYKPNNDAPAERGGTTKKPLEPKVSAWDRIYGEIQQNNPKPAKKQNVIVSDSEEEYDEDMDGFIDDDGDDDGFIDDGYDDVRGGSVSGMIKSIFGYDKRKYRDEDDDLSNMEVGYSAIEKEERISAKIGRMEDLEDIRREEEELRMKKLKLKQKKMKMR